MNEPTYTYRKGVGWVPSTSRVEVREWGYFRVTMEFRDPEPGERYARHLTDDLDDFIRDFKARYNWKLIKRTDLDLGDVVLYKAPVEYIPYEDKYVFTVSIERIVG